MSIWWPVDNVRITGDFAAGGGYTAYNQGGHNGIDIGVGTGTPVYAADNGVIAFEGWGQNHSWMGIGAGISIILRHSWGYTGYAHMSSTVINNGQSISKGQLLGYSGNTGKWTTGPHLHFEALPPNPNFSNGFAGRVNPRNYGLVARGTADAPAKPSAPVIGAQQRQVGSKPANRRVEPNTSKPPIPDQLAAGEIGNFNGWIRGESVEGNNVWFRGATSGNWFWSGAFTSQSTAGLTDLNPVTPAANPNNRTANNQTVNRRKEPTTASEAVSPQIAAGATVTMVGWIKGESVEGIDTWFKSSDGTWSWAGAFSNSTTSGLTDLTPSKEPVSSTPAADQRVVGDKTLYRRSAPTTNSTPDPKQLQPKEVVNIAGWINGQVVDGIGIWYKIKDTNLFAWAGGFTKTDATGLTDLNPGTPTPVPVPDPGPVSVAQRIPNWDEAGPDIEPTFPRPVAVVANFPLPADIKQNSAAVSENGYTIGRPVLDESVGLGPINHIVLHHAASSSLSGVVNTLSGTKGAPTANYAVQDKTLTLMVPEDCTPWTNGRWKSNCHSITFEMCNAGGDSTSGWLAPSNDTYETVAWAMARASIRWKIGMFEYGVNVFGHKDVSKTSTSCPGASDIKKIVARANEILVQFNAGTVTPPVTPPTTPESPDLAGVAKELTTISDSIDNIIDIIT